MKSTILRFGLYGFFFALIVYLIALTFGEELSSSTRVIIGYVTMTLSLSFILFGIKHYRDNVNNGKVSFGKALIIGLLISLITSFGISIADYLYTTVINPDFYEEYKATVRAAGNEGAIPVYSSAFMAMLMYITVLCIGIVISLIGALVFQRK